MILISPTEHSILSEIGVVSSIPEMHGCDFLILPQSIGFQRKTVPDLVASMHDGRLSKELLQMRDSDLLEHRILILETSLDWFRETIDGVVLTKTALGGISISLALERVSMVLSAGLDMTKRLLLTADSREPGQTSLIRRPGPPSSWGGKTRNTGLWLLQAVPGIGPSLAGAIYDAVGNPFTLNVTRAQLLAIPGVGPKTADAILALFE